MFRTIQRFIRRDAGQFLLGVLFFFSIAVSLPRVYATDEVQYYAWIRSVWFDHDVNFENEYRTFATLNPKSGITESLLLPNRIRPKTGLYGNIAPIGSALLWAPWFIATDGMLRLTHTIGIAGHIAADGYSWPYQRAVSYASAVYAFIGILIVRRMAMRWSSTWVSTLSTTGMWLATPLVFYMTVQMPFAHANAFFLSAVFVRIWIWHTENPQDWRPWIGLGATLGALFMVREQLMLFAILPITSSLLHVWDNRASFSPTLIRILPRVLVSVCVLVIVASPQFIAYALLNGDAKPASEVSNKLHWCSPHAVDTLIDFDPSPEPLCNVPTEPVVIPAWSRGALVWSPILALGIIGLCLFAIRKPLYGIPMFVTVLAQIWLNGAFGTTWHLSGAFGFRRYIECTPFFVVGLAYLFAQIRHRNLWITAVALVVILIGWNLGLIINGTVFNALTNVRRGLQWPELWEWQYTLPQRLWELGGMFFDRCRVLKNSC